jgi:hypothetical protein
MNHDSPHALARSLPFRNMTGEPIPAFAVMSVLGVSFEHGIAFLKCGKPDGTFRRHYAINGMQDVAPGRRGTCYRSGDVRALYDEGTPASGESWGLCPGSWKLTKGFPGAAILGIVDGALHLARVDCDPITSVLAKTTAVIPSGASTTAYRIYAGAPGSEVDAGFTSMPLAVNHSGVPIGNGQWVHLLWIDSAWQIQPLRTPALCAVPPCGQGIPARVGDTPGAQTCCLFHIHSGTLTPLLDADGAQARGTVYNVRTQAIPPLVPPHESYVLVHADTSGRWICEVPPTAGTSFTSVPDGSTTTTTTSAPMCIGSCKWNWSIGGNTWTLAEKHCLTGSLDPSSETTTTTTTTADPRDCLCPATTTTTTTGDPSISTTTSTSTTSTTTTTPSPCDCQYPSHCGTEEGECTYTNCAREPAAPTVECTTTTDGPTTTTCEPGSYPFPGSPCDCNFICTPSGWMFVDYGNCPQGAPCSPPSQPCPASSGGGGGGSSHCRPGSYGGGGAGSGGGGGGGGCGNGSCETACYWWNPLHNEWELACGCGSMICDPCTEPYYAACTSEPPSRIGSGWDDHENVPCTRPCSGASFTTTPDPCGSGCKHRGDGEGGWEMIDNDCSGGCVCSSPARESHDGCETLVMPCVPTTTTSGPTTTTTTSTTTSTTTTSTTSTTTTTPEPIYCVCYPPDFDVASCIPMSEADEDGTSCGGPYANVGACESDTFTPCFATTTTTTEEPSKYYCCGNPRSCLSLKPSEAFASCTPYFSGPHNAIEDCQAVCATTTTTTTTCNPNVECTGNCVMTCDADDGWIWGPLGSLCGAGCTCDIMPWEAELIGTPCTPANPQPTIVIPCCNNCAGATVDQCGSRTTTTPAP